MLNCRASWKCRSKRNKEHECLAASILPEARTAEDVAAALAAVVSAMADGELTPDEAALVASVLEMRRKSIETIEHENRLRLLEKAKSNDVF
jgi:hypothetical protein